MNPWILFVAGLLCLTATAHAQQNEGFDAPPPALDEFYPPRAQGPVYLFEMLELNKAMTGTAVNLLEQDFENAAAHFATLAERYAVMSELVPEWAMYFDQEAVAELGSATQSRDQGRAMAALGRVGGTCHACHVNTMAAVQQKYHWGDFAQISITDPVTNQSVGFAQLMQQVALSYDSIGIDLGEGQGDRAVQHAEDFEQRFAALGETCGACHQTERHYFVDPSVNAMVGELVEAVKSPAPDPTAIGQLAKGIGTESCHKCHLVHIPAASAHARWQLAGSASHDE